MDDLLQKETERQRRLLEEARKAVEHEKARMRQGSARRIEPRLDEPVARDFPAGEPRLEPLPQRSEVQAPPRQPEESPVTKQNSSSAEAGWVQAAVRLRSIPDMRSALIPLEENTDGAAWSKPFSLVKADMEPWLSFLRGYRESCLFPHAASDELPLRVDAAVQALLELKGIDLKVILEPAVQINGPVEYLDETAADTPFGGEAHENPLAKAVERGREMGNHLYDALLGEGYVNLAQAWEKVHGRKPNVSELHFMLTTGRVKPPVELQPRQPDVAQAVPQPKAAAEIAEASGRRREETPRAEEAPKPAVSGKAPAVGRFRALAAKFGIADKRKFLFHLSHLLLVGAVILAYCIAMRVFD